MNIDNNFLVLNLILFGFWIGGILLIAFGVKRLKNYKIELTKKNKNQNSKLIKRKITVTYIVLIWFLVWEFFVSETWIREIFRHFN